MTHLKRLIIMICIMLLAACIPLTGRLGEGELMKILTSFDGPPLTPVSDSNPSCPNISGKYSDTKMFLLEQFPMVDNRNGIVVKENILNGRLIHPGQGMPFYYHDTKQFYQQAVLDVVQKDKTLTIALMDNKHLPYKRVTIDLNHPMIGCLDGALVVRESSYGGGGDGRMSFASAKERQLRKLPNGDLEAKNRWRDWYYSYGRLIGYGSDNHPRGTEPRKRAWTVIIPTVK